MSMALHPEFPDYSCWWSLSNHRSYLENGFNQNTFITRSNHVNDELYLNLTDFQSVLSGTLDENFLIGKHINIIGLATIYYVTIYTNVYIFFWQMFWVRLWIVVMSKIFSVPGESNKKSLNSP